MMKTKYAAVPAFLICLLTAGAARANTLRSLSVEPTYECAGIIAALGASDDTGRVTLEVKEAAATAFRPAHDFIRYDQNHMATSLFNLKPGTSYDIRATLNGQSVTSSFSTRPEFTLPAPLRTVVVTNTAQLTAAVSAAQPGDEIVLSPGNYAGGLNIAASGTAAHPLVIRGNIAAAERSKPVDRRSGLPAVNGAGYSPVVTVTGAYVVLDGLRIENASLIGISLKSTKYCTVQGCQITGRGSGYNQAIYVNGGGSGGGRHLLQENYLQDTGPGTGYGILQHNHAGPGTVIRRNIITGFHDGINPSGDELELTDALLPETHPDVLGAWPNHSTDVYENVIRISGDDDIETDGIAVNQRIFRNLLSTGAGESCTNALTIAPAAPGPFFFVRNVAVNFREGGVKYNTASGRGTIRNCFFYHNTFKNDRGAAQRGTLLTLWEGNGDGGSPSKNTFFKNNIFVGDKMLLQRLVTTHTPGYNPNMWYSRQTTGILYQWGKAGPYYDTFAAWRNGTGEEAQGSYADPLVDDNIFCLKTGSPAIDRGVIIPGINDSYSGAGPDMGALEFNADPAAGPVPGTVPGTVPVTDTGTVAGPVPPVPLLPDSTVAFKETLADAAGYPNPWKAGNPSSPGITFKNLTGNTKIRIYTLEGNLVKEISEPGSALVQWNVAAENIGSGIYLCMITNDKGDTKKQKIAIIR